MSLEGVRNLFVFILILGGLIFFHELGHFLAAVRLNVKITEFGIGFPPRLKKLFTWRGTDFTLNWIPLGGFVRPTGEDDPTIAGGLAASSPWTRLAVLSAGSLANFIVGFLIFVLGFSLGWPDQVSIDSIIPGAPAESAGLRPGDIVLTANGNDIHRTSLFRDIVHSNLGQPITLQLQRGDDIIDTTVIPRAEWPEDQGPIGITMTWEIVKYPLTTASVRAIEEVTFIIRETLLLPVRLLSSQVVSEEVRLVSPVGLKIFSDQAVQASVALNEWFPILQMTALISVALGLTNLLPIPALDGGRISFVLLELIRGRRINAEHERWVHAIGMLMLLGLMFVLVIQDIVNPIF